MGKLKDKATALIKAVQGKAEDLLPKELQETCLPSGDVVDPYYGEVRNANGDTPYEHSEMCVCYECGERDAALVKAATTEDGIVKHNGEALWWEKEENTYGMSTAQSAWASGSHYTKGGKYKGNSKPHKKACTHKATEQAFRLRRCAVYGGKGFYQYGADEFDLWLDCGDHASRRPLHLPEMLALLLPSAVQPPR